MMRRAAGLALLVLAASAPLAARAANPPDWLIEASRRASPAQAARAHAITLHDEQIVEVPSHGRIVVTTRRAVRILAASAADDAIGRVRYVKGSSAVTSFRAWTLDANGKVVRHWENAQVVDASDLDAGELYTDFRHRQVQDAEIQAGETFAWEAVTEEDPLFAQWRWWFQDEQPVALSRFELRLPAGLDVNVHAEHLQGAESAHAGATWSWTMRDLPAKPEESLAPERPDLGPYLCVQAVATDGDRSPAGLAFRDWPSVARWTTELASPPGAVTPPLAAMGAKLAAQAADTVAQIAVIARYVQGLNYVATEDDIGRGWGYRPHAAAAVLAAGYGDCKDKANLLCTLLRAAGHEAWLLPVYYGSRDWVDSAWASPIQFNHCIVAIRMPAAHRGLQIEGRSNERLMPFDPTDALTTFGDLSTDLQGAWGLLVAPNGGLAKLPLQPPAQSWFHRRIDATLSPDGALSATVAEHSIGQSAVAERSLRRSSSLGEYQGALEHWLSAQGGSVAIRSWTASEDTLAGRFALSVDYDSPRFANAVGGRLLTFRSAFTAPRRGASAMDSTRSQPIAIAAACEVETLSVRLPAGFAVDERPADLHVANDLGRVDATWQVQGDGLVVVRSWEMAPRTVGPERWADVRKLYAARRYSEDAPVVLTSR
jgi:transglutaminase-like putative cysteine protease